MKTFLLILCILYSITSFSQPYLPMLEEGNVWNVEYHSIDGDIIAHPVEIIGEIEINGKIYKEVNFEYSGGICNWREENGIIYGLNTSNEEVIQYNFNLELGDIFEFGYESCGYSTQCGDAGIEFQVTSVETQFIAGENRKVIELKDDVNFPNYIKYWIEGIGSLNGVDPHEEFIDVGTTLLVCFTKDNITTFFNGATTCDRVILGTNDFHYKNVILYPNPVRTTSILYLTENARIDKIIIYDVSGRILKNETIVNNDYSINNAEFKSGIYLYQLFSKEKMVKTDKFLVN